MDILRAHPVVIANFVLLNRSLYSFAARVQDGDGVYDGSAARCSLIRMYISTNFSLFCMQFNGVIVPSSIKESYLTS